MRRGLISWSSDEVPASVLDSRLAKLVEKVRAERLQAVLVYASFARPAAVSWLTHFVPYWGECLLAVLPEGQPVLLAAFSKRVQSWISEVSHVGEIIPVPNLGQGAVSLLKKRVPALANGHVRIGVVELDDLPWTVAEPMVKEGWGKALVDASALFAAVRQPADDSEIRLAQHGLRLAASALDAIPAKARQASKVLSAIEAAARSAGAEDLIVRVAPDLSGRAVLERIENDAPLGDRYAVQVSLAYKGVWIRTARCISSSAFPDSWRKARDWFAEAAARLDGANIAAAPAVAAPQPAALSAWTIEASLGTNPLSLVSQSEGSRREEPSAALPGGSLAVLSVQLALEDGAWYASAPVVVSGKGRRTELIVAR